ncbi:MAG TPA: hypothetical protein VIA06_22140 [Candidatus Dormibacteraeota bacterium]|jgi:hypothetical protein|nr:hypothetical protein [Candidatus Dormibacteraeota bacterium]
MTPILAGVVEEGERLLDLTSEAGLSARLLGGVAVHVSCPDAMSRPSLRRTYKDLDLAASRRQTRQLQALLREAGYEPNERFNALHGSSRLLFYDMGNERQLDIFLGTFEMCHKLDLEPRLEIGSRALAPADLLLLKLQVVELNEKDATDALALLVQFEARPEDAGDCISTDRIGRLCAADWGWYTTLGDNLERARGHAPFILADAADVTTVEERIGTLRAAMEAAPKSGGWRLRARVGRRMRWYETPEEVG